MPNNLRRQLQVHRNFILYAFIGGGCALLDFVVFTGLYKLLHMAPVSATVVSTTLGITSSFLLNSFLNFRVTDRLRQRYVTFYGVGLIGLLISALVLYVASTLGGMAPVLAKALSIPLVVAVQYGLNKRYSFAQVGNITIWQLVRRYWIDLALLSVAAGYMIVGASYLSALDDTDNMLGGMLMNHGQLPYRDFFSHHAPGMYVLSWFLYPLTHNNLYIYRLLFAAVLFGLLVGTYLLFRRFVSAAGGRLFVLFALLMHLVGWSQLPLGEPVAAYSLAAACALTLCRLRRGPLSLIQLSGVAVLLSLVPLFSLSYIFAAGIVYLLTLWLAVRPFGRQYRLAGPAALRALAVFSVPYVLYGFAIAVSGVGRSMAFELFTFNARYYAPLVDQPTSGIVSTFVGNILGSLAQIGTLLSHALSPADTVALLLLSVIGVWIWLLVRQKQLARALAVAGLLLFIDPQVNIFNGPAIAGGLGEHSQHSIPYLILVSLAAACVLAPLLTSRFSRPREYPAGLRVYGYMFAVVIPLILAGYSANILNQIFVRHSLENYSVTAAGITARGRANVINQVLGPRDYAWTGPADFAAQLYLRPQRATGYTFFMPWQDSCPRCRQQFVSQLQSQRPAIIAFGPYMYKGRPWTYSPEVRDLLQRDYRRVADPRLSGYYFLSSRTPELYTKLRSLGYDTTSY